MPADKCRLCGGTGFVRDSDGEMIGCRGPAAVPVFEKKIDWSIKKMDQLIQLILQGTLNDAVKLLEEAGVDPKKAGGIVVLYERILKKQERETPTV